MRVFLGAGLVRVGLGLLLMSGIDPSDDWTTLLAGFVVAGVGIGFINPPLATTAIGVVEPRRAAPPPASTAPSARWAPRSASPPSARCFQSKVSAKLDAALANAPLPHRAVNHIAEAVSSGGAEAAARGVPAPVRGLVADASRRAFIDGLNEILIVAAVVAFVGAALAVLLVRRRDFVTAPADAAG